MNFASILPKTSGSARQLVSSRPCSTSPATQPSKQTRPAARTDRRCRSNEKNKKTKKHFQLVRCTAHSLRRVRAAGAGFATLPNLTRLIPLI